MPTSIAHLTSRALIAIGGADWRGFLQGLLTQDVETIQPDEVRFGALLTPQGRLLYDLFIVGRPEPAPGGCWLDCVAERRAAPDDTPVLAAWGDAAPVGPGWAPDPRLAALGWRGYGAAAEPNAAEADYERHRLALGAPGPVDWGEDRAYPLEADFDLLNGVDFRKGCFVGQETTSRMKRRGAIKSRMLPIAFDGPPPAAGSEILAGTLRAGETLSGMDGRAIALVRLDRIEGDRLTVDGRPCAVERPDWTRV